jgi:Icc-related predicted phosphoesterase
MRLLAVADQLPHVPLVALVQQHRPDVIVTLGDLEADWLDSLERFPTVPIVGVYGNHDDGHYLEAGNRRDLHLRGAEIDGVSFTGFEGCVRYKRDAPLQYDQDEATKLARHLPAADVLIAHSPPRGIHEEPDDRAHEGFEALRAYLDRHRPRLMLHGHTPPPPRGVTRVGPTTVVHVVGARALTLPN